MTKGISSFGKQYEIMYKNDTHAENSVDRILVEKMIKLDDSSVEYLYNSYTDLSNYYKHQNRIFLENIVNTLKRTKSSETIDNIILYCRNIVKNCDTDDADMIFGGTEEEIVKRGTYWCTDIARVACILLQIAGLPSRILITANTKFAYCGHVVVEVFYENKWGVTDPTNGTVIRHQNRTPASAWEIYNDCILGSKTFYQSEQYESVGISNYYVNEKEKYSYEISRLNEYYAKILSHSQENWVGGIRWVHDEDSIPQL